jgi:uncharacterized protein YjbI with pentapeptide repeats
MATPKRWERREPMLPAALEPSDDPPAGPDARWEDLLVRGDHPEHDAEGLDAARCRVEARFIGASWPQASFTDVVVEDADLSGAILEELRATRVVFRRCRLSGVVIHSATLRDVAFLDCRMDGANLRMTTWERTELVGCHLRDAELYGAKLGGGRLLGCDLGHVELARADLTGADLRGSTLDDVRGADRLRGATIGADQLVPAALAVFAALSITLDDGGDPGDPAPPG